MLNIRLCFRRAYQLWNQPPMIHSLFIISSSGMLLFKKNLTSKAESLLKDGMLVAGFLNAISHFASELSQQKIQSMNLDKYKFLCGNFGAISIVFYVDMTEDEYKLRQKMRRLADAFLFKYEEVLRNWGGELSIFDDFEIDSVITSTLKVVLIGLSGVGKTSITHLIEGTPIPLKHLPTITYGISDLMISGDCQISVWDLAGQEQFRALWKKLLAGADIVFLISDSQKENVYATRDLYESYRKFAPDSARFFVIANKQDLPNSLPPKTIREIFQLPTFEMIAINPLNRIRMNTIIELTSKPRLGSQPALPSEKSRAEPIPHLIQSPSPPTQNQSASEVPSTNPSSLNGQRRTEQGTLLESGIVPTVVIVESDVLLEIIEEKLPHIPSGEKEKAVKKLLTYSEGPSRNAWLNTFLIINKRYATKAN